MNKGKLIRWGIVIFVAFYILSNPQGAANSANGLMGNLGDAGNSLSIFVNGLGE